MEYLAARAAISIGYKSLVG